MAMTLIFEALPAVPKRSKRSRQRSRKASMAGFRNLRGSNSRWSCVATQDQREFDPRKFLKPAMEALRDLCRDRFERFGTAGNASKIKVIAMDEMAKRYAAGKL